MLPNFGQPIYHPQMDMAEHHHTWTLMPSTVPVHADTSDDLTTIFEGRHPVLKDFCVLNPSLRVRATEFRPTDLLPSNGHRRAPSPLSSDAFNRTKFLPDRHTTSQTYLMGAMGGTPYLRILAFLNFSLRGRAIEFRQTDLPPSH